MASIFSKIVAGEIPCYKVAETDRYLAFLDIFPLREGHTLVIPKHEINHWTDLSSDDMAGITVFAQHVSRAIRNAFPCERIGWVVAGFEVPHAHLHLIPVDRMEQMEFSNDKLSFSAEQFQAIVKRIQQHL